MDKRTFPQEAIEALRDFGLKVYMRNRDDSWCVFADGDNIAYAQYEGQFGGVRVSTIHKPNRDSGTGFALSNPMEGQWPITEKYARSGFVIAPHWATSLDRQGVVKYKGIEEYRAHSGWNAQYTEVTQ